MDDAPRPPLPKPPHGARTRTRPDFPDASEMPWHASKKALVRRGVGFAVIGALAVGFLMWVGFYEPEFRPEAIEQVDSVPGENHEDAEVELPDDDTNGKGLEGDQTVHFPALGTTEVELPAGEAVTVDALGLTLEAVGEDPPTALTVGLESASAKEGLHWTFQRADGSSAPTVVRAVFDYSDYRNAGGGDWDDRLVVLGSGGEIASVNDGIDGTVTVEIPLTRSTAGGASTASSPDAGHAQASSSTAGAAVTLAASASGDSGNFAATGLASSASWSAGNPTGDFAWSYPIEVPSSVSGLDPSIVFTYSSSAVDGLNESTNNQPSIIGEGFAYEPGFIERKYVACRSDDEDNPNNPSEAETGGDLCWRTDNAYLSLNGAGGELIRDDATGEWKIKNDDASKVEKLTGAINGDNNGEYWRVTTSGGIQYYFGLNRLPEFGSGDAETESTATVPVFGNHSSEPCHATKFSDSWCQQAWRWELDWVVDTHDNAIAYFYEGESNHYLLNLDEDGPVAYDRAANLIRVDYSLRADDAYAGATNRVVFNLADRCVSSSTCDSEHPENWPDVPLDQACDGSASDCENIYSPVFFTDQRLASITTQVYTGGAWNSIDRWTLDHAWPDPGDTTRAALWLDGITRTGLTGASPTSMPSTTFDGVQMYNRVQKTLDTKAPMNWFRISAIHNGTGGTTTISYTDRHCDAKNGVMPSSPESNDMRCMPVITTTAEDNGGEPEYDWYHKYLVTAVADIDTTGVSPAVVTKYQYLGAPAWRFTDDDGLTDPDYKTWSGYRGYSKVRTSTGDGSDDPLISEATYFRGLDDQKLPDGTSTSVKVDGITDHDEYAGRVRSTTSFLDGSVISKTVHTPWRSSATATRVRDWATVEARYTGTSRIEASALLSDGSWRTVASTTEYDSWGMAIATESLGEVDASGDEQCSRITYARNESKWIMNKPVRTESVSTACDATPSYPSDLIADERIYYDGATTFGTPPTKGDITQSEIAQSYTNGKPNYLFTGAIEVDQYGRGTDSTDVDGNVTTTTYTPATGGPLTKVVTTNPLGHTSTQIIEPLRGNPVQSIDANGNMTEMAYDSLGRLISGWGPDRPRASGNEPIAKYEYVLSDTDANAVVTSGINANNTYTSTIELYDGLLRPVQTQIPAPDGGRVLTTTFYDTRGMVHKQYGAFYNTEEPQTALFTVSDNDVPGMTAYEYDTAGRTTAEVFYSFAIEQYRTTNIHDGEKVSVIDPDGRAATSIMDAKGNTSEVRTMRTDDLDGPYDSMTYEYDHADRLTAMTDPGGSTWSYEYDLLGRQIASNDPDTGRTETTYYDNGLTESVTDATGQSLWYEYDKLGRPIYVMQDDFWGDLVEAYEYDLFGDGLPATTSTWDEDGNLYKTRILAYDDANRPVGIRYTLDGDFGALDRSFDFRYTYNPDGSVAKTTYPSGGSLAIEDVITTYSDLGLPQATYSARQWYVSNTEYTKFAEIAQLAMDPDGPNVNGEPVAWQAYTYADGTRRLTGSTFQISTGPDHVITDSAYTYSDAGMITSIDNQSDLGADTQCFAYDYLKRITDAWTGSTADACESEPTGTGDIGGVAPYWQSWTFDADGNRESQVDHLAGETIGYEYDADQPHTAVKAIITNAEGAKTLDYAYDETGNTITRPDESGNVQTLSWSVEGQLESTKTDGDVTDYDYTADGTRISRTDPDGTMTVFLPGMELVKDPDGDVTASRYYSHGGQIVAVRTNDDNLSWLCSDNQGTATATVDADTHATDVRYFDIYGNERGQAPAAWVDERGFLGATEDPSGLTHLGAREYDPILGRFISADPLMNPLDSQQLSGYAYASYSPVTFMDPTGMACEHARGSQAMFQSCMAGVDPKADKAGPLVDGTKCTHNVTMQMCANTGGLNLGDDTPAGISPDEVEEAEEVANTSLVDVIIDVGADILLDFLGVNDIMDCLGKGDMWACGSLLLDFIPWAKVAKIVGKLAKSANKIYSAVSAFKEKLAWARDLLGKVADVRQAAASRARQAWADLQSKLFSGCNSFTAGTLVVMADGSAKPIEEVEAGEEVLATDENTGETSAREVVTTIEGTGDKTLVAISVDTDGDGGADDTVTATDEHPMWIADPATTTDAILAQHARVDATSTLTDAVPDPAEADGMSSAGGGGPPPTSVITATESDDAPDTPATLTDSAGPIPGQWLNAIDLKPGQLLRTSAGTWIQITAIETRTEHTTVHNLTVAEVHTYHVSAANTDFLTHNTGGTCSVNPNVKHGDLGELATQRRLESDGYTNITAEVPFTTRDGVKFRADFVAQNPNGNWVAIEVKTGAGASISDGQAVGYPALQNEGAVLRSSRVPGLTKGDTIQMPFEVDWWTCPICGSGPS